MRGDLFSLSLSPFNPRKEDLSKFFFISFGREDLPHLLLPLPTGERIEVRGSFPPNIPSGFSSRRAFPESISQYNFVHGQDVF